MATSSSDSSRLESSSSATRARSARVRRRASASSSSVDITSVQPFILVAERSAPSRRQDEVEEATADPDLANAPRSSDTPADGHDEGTGTADVHLRAGSLRLRERSRRSDQTRQDGMGNGRASG